MVSEDVLPLLRACVFAGGLAGLLACEIFRPYRAPRQSRARRWARNLGFTGLNTVVLTAVFSGLVAGAAGVSAARGGGLFGLVSLPWWGRALATVLFMDLLLWVWHLLNHVVPLFWRFHRVHHADLEMDASTATRFHLGELAISALIKAGVVFLLGADLASLAVFEAGVVFFAQIEHSSARFPAWFERVWFPFFVTPSMHRVHHSVVIRERNTNYGTIFSWWDTLFGTLETRPDQARIRIGVGAYARPGQVTFGRLLLMPFTPPVR